MTKPFGSKSRLATCCAGIVDSLAVAAGDQTGGNRTGQRWLVLGASSGDGGTTTAIGIARAMARRNGNGLLVDANLRNPDISRSLKEAASPRFASPGLAEFVRDERSLDEICRREHSVGDFAVIPAGEGPDDSFELLRRTGTRGVMEDLGERFEFVVIDTPSLDSGLDALTLAPHVDGCVLVVCAGRTGRRAVVDARRRIEQAGGTVVGLVLNRHKQWIPKLLGRWL